MRCGVIANRTAIHQMQSSHRVAAQAAQASKIALRPVKIMSTGQQNITKN